MDIPAILRSVPLFAGLEEDELAAVAGCVTPFSAGGGETVIAQGSEGDRMYVVWQGRMAVWKEDPAAGRSVQVNEMGPGCFFGEMSLLEPVRTSATVTALEPSRLLGLRRKDLDVLLTGRAELAAKIWRAFALQFAERLRHATDRLITPPGGAGR